MGEILERDKDNEVVYAQCADSKVAPVVVGREYSGMYMNELEADGRVGGNLEEIEWMGCTKVGTEVES